MQGASQFAYRLVLMCLLKDGKHDPWHRSCLLVSGLNARSLMALCVSFWIATIALRMFK